MEQFIPDLKQSFEISEQHLTGEGSSFQFLRRTYVEIEGGLKVMPGKYAESMIEMYEEKMGKVKMQKLPCGPEVLEADGSVELKAELASLYRSLVGCGIYLSQERPDVSYTIKELASTMSFPTTSSLRKLGKLIGYLKGTIGQHSILEMGEPGQGLIFGTLHNVADLGTKPLSRNRIMLILYWCNARSGDDEKLGEEEYTKMEESRMNRVKIQKLAKLLNRILLVGGLEQATASRTEGLEEKVEKSNGIMMMVVVVMALMIAPLAWAVYKLWGIVEELKTKIADAKDSAYVNGVSTRAYVQGMREEMKEMKSYSQKIHRGLIKASGYINKEEVSEEDWQHWNYIQRSNEGFDLRRIHAQIKAYKQENERDDGPIDLRPYRNTEDEEMQEESEEETVTVRLDGGEVVQIPLRFVEPREPESEDEAAAPQMEDVAYTCENAQHFFLHHVQYRWEDFHRKLSIAGKNGVNIHKVLSKPATKKRRLEEDAEAEGSSRKEENTEEVKKFFADAPQPLFPGDSYESDLEIAEGCFRYFENMFSEIEECRAFELLRNSILAKNDFGG
eukprot:g32617.t1